MTENAPTIDSDDSNEVLRCQVLKHLRWFHLHVFLDKCIINVHIYDSMDTHHILAALEKEKPADCSCYNHPTHPVQKYSFQEVQKCIRKKWSIFMSTVIVHTYWLGS